MVGAWISPWLGLLVAQAPQTQTLTWAQALELAERSGAVKGARAAVETRRSVERGLSALTLNPELELQLGHTRQPDGAGLYSQLSVVQPLPLAGHGTARKEAAAAETHAWDVTARALVLEHKLQAAQCWLQLWAAQSSLELAGEEETLAASFQKKVEEALTLGGTTRLEVAEARAYAAEARLVHLAAEGALVEARLSMTRALDLPVRPGVTAQGAPPPLEPTDGLEEEESRLLMRAAQLPEVAQQRAAAQAARTRAREARAQAGWRMHVGGVAQLQFDTYPTAYAILGFTPPLFERGDREAAVFLAEADRVEGLAREALSTAEGVISGAFHDVVHAREVYDTLSHAWVPAAAEAASLAEVSFQGGQTSVLEVLRARRALASARARQVAAHADAAAASLRLQLLRAVLP